MANINKKDIILIYRKKKPIQLIYKGLHLVWQGIRSCFSGGFWVNEKPWTNTDGWKNN
jgi:hypothetical protein